MAKQPVSLYPSTSPRSFRELPDHPDLDHLRGQAKDLLRRYTAADPAAIGEVREHFNPESDQPLTLVQAQLVVARAYGHDSWPKLKACIEGVHRQALVEAIRARDHDQASAVLRRRPELANAFVEEYGRRMIHLAVLGEDVRMLRLLMEHGADAHHGLSAHREAATALQIALDRGLEPLVRVIEEIEAQRRRDLGGEASPRHNGLERLFGLIRGGQSQEAIAMLQADRGLVSQIDRDGATPLHAACSAVNEPVIAWLDEQAAGGPVGWDRRDASGYTPLDRVVLAVDMSRQGRLEPARRVLSRWSDRMGERTALVAAATGDLARLEAIHAASPAVLREKHRWYWGGCGGVLSAASVFDQRGVVSGLLALGLDPDEALAVNEPGDEEAWSWGGPLWRAAAFGRLEVARLLLDEGADPNAVVFASGWVLDQAYGRGDPAMIELLVQRGARPSTYTACGLGHEEAFERVFAEQGDDAVAVREMVWAAAYATNLAVIEKALPRLLELQDRLSPEQLDWHDLLVQPMRLGGPAPGEDRYADRFVILEKLLEASGEPNTWDRFGMALLHVAAARGDGPKERRMPTEDRLRFARTLLEAGADPMQRDDVLCSTALGWACRYGRIELVKLLLEYGVPVEEEGTPVWAQPRAWAAKMGHRVVADILLG
ncbi:MAG: ankyrin repeat domain-containing protein [Planctomycetota bacterium]